MGVGPNVNRRQARVVIAAMGVLVLLGVPLLLRSAEVPRVTAQFVAFSDSLRPDRADFAITNYSTVMVFLVGFRKMADANPLPCQVAEIATGGSAVVALDFAKPIEFNTQVELQFRRPDTAAEEVREMGDSVLRSIGIKSAGLNPDSSANLFYVTSSVPARVVGR